ncbi:MAG: OmpH family outer membrane protein [Pseudomonadota bacterium]
MNKKMTHLVMACLTSAAMWSAGAVQAAELNIVVLDSVRAILESDRAKVLIEAANKEMQPEQDALRELADKLQSLQERARTDAEVMSDADKRQIQKELEDLRIDIEFGSQKLQKEAQDKRNEILQVLAPNFEKVRNDLIQVDQIDFILQPQALIYANSKHDITKRVTEKLNELE